MTTKVKVICLFRLLLPRWSEAVVCCCGTCRASSGTPGASSRGGTEKPQGIIRGAPGCCFWLLLPVKLVGHLPEVVWHLPELLGHLPELEQRNHKASSSELLAAASGCCFPSDLQGIFRKLCGIFQKLCGIFQNSGGIFRNSGGWHLPELRWHLLELGQGGKLPTGSQT